VGSDGAVQEGHGGVGTIFTCKADGAGLERLAVGFWNPFGIVAAAGRVYCVDNDPDASPPCRLIEVVYGGDYGHRWEYGRAGVHPLQAWNGELPGTLPMICGTGEAPTAVVSHRGHLWVTSWGDHRIERYALARAPRKASLEAVLAAAVQG
ncbi:MAG TPA: cytochrome C, partial [Lacipirellulaceae bacterium]|nr:cytochrome C [Lacipirellulaceae bacterium]